MARRKGQMLISKLLEIFLLFCKLKFFSLANCEYHAVELRFNVHQESPETITLPWLSAKGNQTVCIDVIGLVHNYFGIQAIYLFAHIYMYLSKKNTPVSLLFLI